MRFGHVPGENVGPRLRWQRRLSKLGLKGPQSRIGLRHGLAGRQPADDGQPPVGAMVERALRAADDGLGAERRRHIEGAADLHAAEITIGDADDRERVPIERDRCADHIGAAAEFALPEPVAQNRYRPIRPAAAPVIVGREGPAEMRGHAERVEESAADEQALRGSRFATRAQVEAWVAVRGDTHQDVLMIADVLPLRISPASCCEQADPPGRR